MDELADFAATLRQFMARSRCTNHELAGLTGISVHTIENWTSGEVRRPRFVGDMLKLARALALDAQSTTAFLVAAGHPPLSQLQARAQQSSDSTLAALLTYWEQPAPAVAAEPDDPAPARPNYTHAYQLRPPIADFVGRVPEIERLVSALQTVQTQQSGAIIGGIHGMGGIGKTELAYYVTDRVRSVFPGSQIVLNLEGTSALPLTAAQALQTIIHTLTPNVLLPEDLPTLEQHYRTLLHHQRVLILADDARDVAQVRPLIPPRGSALLITSRQRFSLPGMVSLHLEQLSEAEAVALLHTVCWRLSEEEAHTIARSCGYLPLALRVSGSMLHNDPALSVAACLERLMDERHCLTQLRDPDDQELDVEASLAMSYARLEAQQQHVFRQLGVLVADFDKRLAQAIVIAGAGVDIEAVLHLLLRRNLVMYDATRGRWRLHNLVRALARRYLELAGETDAVYWRYAWAAVRIAQETHDQYLAGGPDIWMALLRFDAEHPHIEAARRWGAAHAGTPVADHLLLEDACATYHIGQLRYNVQGERIPQLERALGAARRLGDQYGEGQIFMSLGHAYNYLGMTQQARSAYTQALTIWREAGDRRNEGKALGNLGNTYKCLGKHDRAVVCYEQNVAIMCELGDQHGIAQGLNNLGAVYAVIEELPQAIYYYQQALGIARELGDRHTEGIVLNNLGNTYICGGELHTAIGYYEHALAIVRELDDRFGEGTTLNNLSNAYRELGDIQQAIAAGEDSLAIAQELGDRHQEGYTRSYLGRTYAAQGDHQRAASAFAQALAIFRTVGDREGAAKCGWYYGHFLTQQGEHERALSLIRESVSYEAEIGHIKAAQHAALLARLDAGEGLLADRYPADLQHVVGSYDINADV